jgi:DNA-binding CsgD family transcriptional regulator
VNLSAKQTRVLELMVDDGMKLQQAAAAMSVTRNTAHNHLTRAKAKLGAKTLGQAMVFFDRTRRTAQCPETSG